MSRFSFKYDSDGLGSSTVTITVDDKSVMFRPTYAGRNPLGDILSAVAESIDESSDRFYLCWFSEPGFLQFNV